MLVSGPTPSLFVLKFGLWLGDLRARFTSFKAQRGMAGETGKRNFAKLYTSLRAKIKDVSTVEQLLAPATNDTRLKLLELYSEAIVEDVQAAVEGDLDRNMWRYGFYIIIEELRRLRPSQPFGVTGQLAQFFTHANGFYTLLITTLCEQHGVAAAGIIDPYCVRQQPTGASPHQNAARAVCVRALIALGDLARYADSLDSGTTATHGAGVRAGEARRRYAQARLLQPADGAAFNQLAVLATHAMNDGVDAAFYYLCSLATARPFASAQANLDLLLEKVRARALPQLPALAGRDLALLLPHGSAIVSMLCTGTLQLCDLVLRKDRLDRCDALAETVAGACEASLTLPATHPDTAPGPAFMLRLLCTPMLVLSHLIATGGSTRQIDAGLNTALRLLIALCRWLTVTMRAGGPVSSVVVLQPWLATAHVALQWVTGPPVWEALLARRETATVNLLWPALSAMLNAATDQDEGKLSAPATLAAALPEDVELHGVAALGHAHRDLDFSASARAKVLADPVRPRMHGLVRHARMLADCREFGFVFSPDAGTFMSAADASPPRRGPGGSPQRERERVMKAMAQRRLEAEVEQLEADCSAATRGNVLAAVLVPDTLALALSLSAVNELVSQQFTLVVPLAVVAGLDALKAGSERVNHGARAAVRALQEAMHRASPHLRVQFAHETLAAPVHAHPAPTAVAAPHSQTSGDDHSAILACARFFVSQGQGRAGVVTVLSADDALAAKVCSGRFCLVRMLIQLSCPCSPPVPQAASEGIPCQSAIEFLRRVRSNRRRAPADS
eukprot:m.66087 g.66087  ORF g.66087 m.66087 type:complete len:790 (+) comp12645_c0_seq1:2322-4691(+)